MFHFTLRPQDGFTITELLIALGLSLSVISSLLVGYLATCASSLNLLTYGKLSHDVDVLLNLMTSELMRAGYSAAGASPASNSFELVVFDDAQSNTQQPPKGSGTCVIYAYDRNENGAMDAAELAGFRLASGQVEMRNTGSVANPASCADASGTWLALTDPAFITVSALRFDLLHSACVNTREPNGADDDADGTTDEVEEVDCYLRPPAAGSDDITVETRALTIAVEAHLASDPFVRMARTQQVRVRKDLVRVR